MVKWIKIVTNMFDDEKIKLIETLPEADTLLVIWLKLLTMAGKCNDCGLVYLNREIPYNPEMLSTIMRRPVNVIRLALNEFKNLKMIEIFDDFIQIINWEKHQNVEGMDRLKVQWQQASKKYREKKKLPLLENHMTSYDGHTPDKNRIDKNRKEEKRIEQNTKEKEYYRNEYFSITESEHNEYKSIYPFVDIDTEYMKMKKWLDLNPKKRKKDYPKFIFNWLSNAKPKTEEKDELEKYYL